jgi:membrane-associated protein
MLDVNSIIQAGGILLIAAVIFAESGMFVGFFFPGDTLLLSAGVFAAAGKLPPVEITIAIIALAAILGDNTGYHVGKHFGRRLFKKPDSIVFRKEYVEKAESFFHIYGAKTMLFAHFIPVVRTFAPPVAGVAKMNYKRFFIFDAIGDIIWATSVTLVGYWFGNRIHNLDHYILAILGAVMVITLGPTIYHIIKAVLKSRREKVKPPAETGE